MKLANYKHPTKQDIPTLAPDVEKALEAIGRQVREVTQVLQGKASLTENGNNEIKTLSVKDNTEYEVTLGTLKGTPVGATPIYSSNFEIPRLTHFQTLSDRRVRVRFSFSTPPADPVTVRLLFFGA